MGADRAQTGDAVVVPALARAPSSIACLRTFGRRGIPTIAVSENGHAPGLRSKYADETVRVPDPADRLDAYADALLALAERPEVGTIVPLREADVYVLARDREAFSRHVTPVTPPLETLSRVQDRVELFETARAAGVGMPETAPLDEWDDWERRVIVKPRFTIHAEEYDEGFEHSHSHENSTAYVAAGDRPDPDAYVEEMGHVPLVQEYVPDSDEYAFFALYDRGEPVATFQHRQRRAYKYSGGSSAFRESVDIPDLASAGRRLLDELGWHGLAMVEFLRDPVTGEFELMEVNPRFWTSLPFTIQAGVDFPYYYWLLANGRGAEVDSDYDVGIGGHLLRGELLYLYSLFFEDYPLVERPPRARSIAAVAYSMLRHPRFDVLSVDDPAPFVRDLANAVGVGVGNVSSR